MKWDDGTVTQVNHEHLEPGVINRAIDEDGADIDPSEQLDQYVNIDGEVTDSDNEGEVEAAEGNAIAMGETVEVDGVTWKRVQDISDEGSLEDHPDFDLQVRHHNINDFTREKDLFDLCMPVSYDMLLQIVRDRAEAVNDKYGDWNLSHIEATIKCIFGGAQYKQGTDLWSTKQKGIMPAPDFGRYSPPPSYLALSKA